MTYYEHMKASAKDYLAPLVTKHAGDMRAIASEAGINRTHIYALLKRAGIEIRELPRSRRKAVWQDLQSGAPQQ